MVRFAIRLYKISFCDVQSVVYACLLALVIGFLVFIIVAVMLYLYVRSRKVETEPSISKESFGLEITDQDCSHQRLSFKDDA